jgi:hypothetical protein
MNNNSDIFANEQTSDAFVSQNPAHFDYFYSCLHLFVYSYQQLVETGQTYSRKEIQQKAQKEKNVKNDKQAKAPIEDFLTEMLVEKSMESIEKFGLDNFFIETGVREKKNGIAKGELDIKVVSKSLSGKVYFAFESKRLNKNQDTLKPYIDEGMHCFIRKQYYPVVYVGIAGMIGFVEEEIKKRNKPLPINKIAAKLRCNISGNGEKLGLVQNMTYFNINNSRIFDYQYTYFSKHKCIDGNNIEIHHLLFDYYEILTA